MKIKRFVDDNMRRVLRQVREDQGPDAVILSNRRVDDGIEVIAAVDYDEALIQQALQVPNDEQAPDETPVDSGKESPTPRQNDAAGVQVLAGRFKQLRDLELGSASGASRDELLSLDALRSEISSMRGMIESQFSSIAWDRKTAKNPLRVEVLKNLTKLGIAPDISNMVVDRIGPMTEPQQLWRKPLHELANLLPTAESNVLKDGGTVALIGPTGVGKTTTIAKLATRFVMQHGADSVALISADAHRIGAQEQLATFANILGVRVLRVDGIDALQQTLHEVGNKRLVLIDTEGSSQRDRRMTERLAAYGRNAERVHFYLTLSATCQEAGLDEIVRVFGRVPLSGAVVTKIDEAAQLGCVISTLIRHDLKAAFFCDGQRVPDDLHPAAKKRLWLINQAIDCMRASQVQIDDETMMNRFGAAGAVYA